MAVALSVVIAAPALSGAHASEDPFVTTWRTTTANESITIPTYTAFGAHTIDWGDGTAPATAWFDHTHMYAEPGTYTVSIAGDFTQIRLHDDPGNAEKLVSIDSWGSMRWASMDHAFGAASNMGYNATDTPPPANNPPTADAGSDLILASGEQTTITGSATDPDQADTLTYQWLQNPSDAGVVFGSPNSLTTTVTAPTADADTRIVLILRVSDGTD